MNTITNTLVFIIKYVLVLYVLPGIIYRKYKEHSRESKGIKERLTALVLVFSTNKQNLSDDEKLFASNQVGIFGKSKEEQIKEAKKRKIYVDQQIAISKFNQSEKVKRLIKQREDSRTTDEAVMISELYEKMMLPESELNEYIENLKIKIYYEYGLRLNDLLNKYGDFENIPEKTPSLITYIKYLENDRT